MADFCAPCTVELFGPDDRGGSIRHLNEFAGWLAGRQGYGWALCEGCGWHLIDDKGERSCGDRPRRDALGEADERGLYEQCPTCDAHAVIRAGGAEPFTMPEEMKERARQRGPDVPGPVDTPEEIQRRIDQLRPPRRE